VNGYNYGDLVTLVMGFTSRSGARMGNSVLFFTYENVSQRCRMGSRIRLPAVNGIDEATGWN